MPPGRSLVGVRDIWEVGYSDVLARSWPESEWTCSSLTKPLLLFSSCLRARRTERAEGPSIVCPTPRGVNTPDAVVALEGPVGLESNVYVDAERSSSVSMSGSETKESRGLPLFVLGEEGANEDGKGWMCLKDRCGAVLEMASGVPSWIVLSGNMKESRDCDAEARNVPRQSGDKLRLWCGKCSQRHARSEEGSGGPLNWVAWAAKEDAGGWGSGEAVGRGGGELAKGSWGMSVFES